MNDSTNIEELKQAIDSQREENIKLYEVFQYRLQEKDMQPLICEWRNGSNRLKALLSQLSELEKEEREKRNINKTNAYEKPVGREITSSTYIRADRRMQKEIMSFIGG